MSTTHDRMSRHSSSNSQFGSGEGGGSGAGGDSSWRSSSQPGSTDEDYSSVLVSHQRARKDRMKKELEAIRGQLLRLQEEIQAKKLSHSVFVEENTSYPSEEHVMQLEAETVSLRSDISEAQDRIRCYQQSSAVVLETDSEKGWTCKYCTMSNHPAMTACEACDMPHSPE